MTKHRTPRAKASTPASLATSDLPTLPLSEREIAQEREICRLLREAVVDLRQRNLDNAVVLAQQAARGAGPLVDHFCELGQRFNHLVDGATPRPKPGLRLVKGGAG